jgi:hypothetical protein
MKQKRIDPQVGALSNGPAFWCSTLVAEAAATTRSTYHTSLPARKARRRRC